jgi:hypothetical protein
MRKLVVLADWVRKPKLELPCLREDVHDLLSGLAGDGFVYGVDPAHVLRNDSRLGFAAPFDAEAVGSTGRVIIINRHGCGDAALESVLEGAGHFGLRLFLALVRAAPLLLRYVLYTGVVVVVALGPEVPELLFGVSVVPVVTGLTLMAGGTISRLTRT